jgi:hypothetical protein
MACGRNRCISYEAAERHNRLSFPIRIHFIGCGWMEPPCSPSKRLQRIDHLLVMTLDFDALPELGHLPLGVNDEG